MKPFLIGIGLFLFFISESKAIEYVNICDRGSVIANGIVHSIQRYFDRYENQTLSCDKVFVENLKKLKTLDIAGYCIQQYPTNICENGDGVIAENAFNGLESVESLDLSWAKITKISKESFKKLPKLRRLTISSAGRWIGQPEYDASPFQYLIQLEELDLSNSRLSFNPTFDQKTFFKGLSSLKKLILSYNQIENLQERVFQDLSNLNELNLWANPLNTLPSNLFTPLKNLEYLSLGQSSNAMTHVKLTLPSDVFDGLAKLKRLDIVLGVLQSLHPSQFHSLHKLDTIDLTQNDLASLPQDLFKGLDNLKRVNLKNNNFVSISKSFLGLSENVELDIHATP